MLDFMKEIENVDYISFLPHEENENAVEVLSQNFHEEVKGVPIDGSPLGPAYHVILFKVDEEDEIIHKDYFDAIFTDVREYISELIPQDWYGLVMKKTTKSGPLFEKMIANLKD